MKVNWTVIGILAPILGALIAWAISIEVRLNQYQDSLELSDRVSNLERLLLPVLVDWKVEQELKKVAKLERPNPVRVAPHQPESSIPDTVGVVPKSVKPVLPKMQKDAEDWAQEAIRQGPVSVEK